MVELGEPLQHGPLDHDAEQRRRSAAPGSAPPITDAEILQQEIGDECAHHVLRAVGEIDDVEHAEDDGKAEAQQRVERAVDQTEQQLAEQRLRWECRRSLYSACREGDAVGTGHLGASRRSRPLLLYQRAIAVLERTERLVRRDGRDAACNSPTDTFDSAGFFTSNR